METAWILETKISKKVISTKAKNYLRQDAIDVNKRLVCNIEPYGTKKSFNSFMTETAII